MCRRAGGERMASGPPPAARLTVCERAWGSSLPQQGQAKRREQRSCFRGEAALAEAGRTAAGAAGNAERAVEEAAAEGEAGRTQLRRRNGPGGAAEAEAAEAEAAEAEAAEAEAACRAAPHARRAC